MNKVESTNRDMRTNFILFVIIMITLTMQSSMIMIT